jgi:hypothetical protein
LNLEKRGLPSSTKQNNALPYYGTFVSLLDCNSCDFAYCWLLEIECSGGSQKS